MEDADDVVEVAVVHRVARVRVAQHVLHRRDRVEPDRQRDDVGPRDHDLAHLGVREVEDLADHLLLRRLEQPDATRAVHQQPQLLLAVGALELVGRRNAEQPHQQLRQPVEEPDERPEHDEEHPDGAGHGEGDALGARQRVRLRDDLADHDVQDRDHDEREGHRDRRGDAGRHVTEEILEQPRHRRLADGAESQRADRDAELHRGDEVRRVGDDLAHDACALVALPDQLVEARVTHRDERVLRGHEERVPQDYDDDRAELERGGDAHASLQALARRRL